MADEAGALPEGFEGAGFPTQDATNIDLYAHVIALRDRVEGLETITLDQANALLTMSRTIDAMQENATKMLDVLRALIDERDDDGPPLNLPRFELN